MTIWPSPLMTPTITIFLYSEHLTERLARPLVDDGNPIKIYKSIINLDSIRYDTTFKIQRYLSLSLSRSLSLALSLSVFFLLSLLVIYFGQIWSERSCH